MTVYLAHTKRPGRATIAGLISTALGTLTPPPDGALAAAGTFTLTLSWTGPGDEDLHLFEPGGAHVFFRSKYKTGTAGYLDLDVAKDPVTGSLTFTAQ